MIARNDGGERFVDVARSSGEYFRKKFVGRGAAFADIDNDGDLDILVANLDDRARLLRNDGGNRNNWLLVVPRDRNGAVALGALVTVDVGGKRLVHPVTAATGSSPARGRQSSSKSRFAATVPWRRLIRRLSSGPLSISIAW